MKDRIFINLDELALKCDELQSDGSSKIVLTATNKKIGKTLVEYAKNCVVNTIHINSSKNTFKFGNNIVTIISTNGNYNVSTEPDVGTITMTIDNCYVNGMLAEGMVTVDGEFRIDIYMPA